MKLIYKFGLLLPLLLASCSNNESPDSEISDDSIEDTSETGNLVPQSKNYYQLLVYAFSDSNGDGIGDFKGIVDKLGYLVDLGIEGIWLSPVNPSNCYHGYDVTDYYSIKSDYEYEKNGTNYDHKYLLDKCHEKGISVIMDLVVNHTAANHPWVSQHPNWYSNIDAFPGMKDLDFSKNEVREEMKNVGTHWLDEGFDGFRLDAAMWLFNNKNGTKDADVDHEKNYEYWKEWSKAMRKKNKDCYIIGEVLNKNHDLSYQYANAGFDSTFDFNVREHVYKTITDSSYDYVGKTLKDMKKATDIKKDFILGRPLSNHDIGRFTQVHTGMDDADAYYVTEFEDIRLANALNIMMKGNTFIYYGDEVGLHGTANGAQPKYYNDLNFRTPMPWDAKNGLTKSKNYFTDEVPGDKSTTSVTNSGKTVEQDVKDNNSLYNSAKELLNLKKDNNAIKNGELAKINNLPTNLNGYTLSDDEQSIAFIYNSSDKEVEYEFEGKVLYSTTDNSGDSISLDSKDFAVIKLKS